MVATGVMSMATAVVAGGSIAVAADNSTILPAEPAPSSAEHSALPRPHVLSGGAGWRRAR